VRFVQVQVDSAATGRVLELARRYHAREPAAVRAASGGCVITLTLPNDQVGAFVDAVRGDVDDAAFVLLPLGALPLETPLEELAPSVSDVSRLSTLELVLASLQSIGSWRGLLLFSVLAGVIGGYGLIFDTSYLLVAAMLINPMGAPALVAVTAIAIGDARLFGRGALRFCVSLAAQALAAMALGFGYGLTVSTTMMEQVTALSAWAVLVAFAAGAAGAQTQVKSDRDSLVSGTAAGFMVAAALAPPAAVLGLSLPLGRFDYIGLMAFLLALQFLAISLGGWLVLHAFGVRPAEPSIGRGTARTRTVLAVAVAAATGALVAWQTQQEPHLLRADLSRAALEIARDATELTDGAYLIESSARFTRRDLDRYDRDGLLLRLVVEQTGHGDEEALKERLRHHVRELVRQRMQHVAPFIDVTVVPGPPQ
jgi:uncharacterized membrane protein